MVEIADIAPIKDTDIDRADEVMTRAKQFLLALHDYASASEPGGPIFEIVANSAKATLLDPMNRQSDQDWARMAESEYKERRRRDAIFATAGLFGEPAWDMLLDIFVMHMNGKRISITSACIGACVPASTALRWLTILEQSGFVEREDDATDARRSFVRMSRTGVSKIKQYLAAKRQGPGPLDVLEPRALPRP